MGYIQTAFSELSCLKNQECLNLPLLKICGKIIGLTKTQSQRFLCCVSESVEEEKIFWQTNYLNTDLKKREV